MSFQEHASWNWAAFISLKRWHFLHDEGCTFSKEQLDRPDVFKSSQWLRSPYKTDYPMVCQTCHPSRQDSSSQIGFPGAPSAITITHGSC